MLPALPEVEHVLTEGVQDVDGEYIEIGLVGTDHERQRAVPGTGGPAADGRVDHLEALLDSDGGEGSCRLWRARTQFEHGEIVAVGGEESVVGAEHLRDDVGSREARQHGV